MPFAPILLIQNIFMNKRYLPLLMGLCMSALQTTAQMPYTFSYTTDTYVPLTGGTSLNGSHVWDSYNDNYTASIGFTFRVDTTHITDCFLQGENAMATDTNSADNSAGFGFTDADLLDRGALTGSATLSPLRYTVTGSPGSRIFKLEIANAGFHAEKDNYGTMNDSTYIQEWLYEGSNIVELRYGPSKITYGSDYFSFPNQPMVGYVNNITPSGDGKIFVLSGDPTAPTIDSIEISGGMPVNIGVPLNSYPPNGMVYRFTPRSTKVSNVMLEATRVYPTAAQSVVNVDYANSDGQYKVVSISGSATQLAGALQNGITHIDVSTLPAGMYLLQLQNSSGKSTKKFIKL